MLSRDEYQYGPTTLDYSLCTDHDMHICHIQCRCLWPSQTDSTFDIGLDGKLNMQHTSTPYTRWPHMWVSRPL